MLNVMNLLPNFIVLNSTPYRNPISTPDRISLRRARAVKDHGDFWSKNWVDYLQ